MSRRTFHEWLAARSQYPRRRIRQPRSAAPHRRSLRFEPLEDRRLLAIFSVTNLDDEFVGSPGDAPGTLRQAIFDANLTSDPDEIVFQDGLAGTILLDQGELSVSTSLSIIGPGADLLTIDAGQNSRVFRFSTDDQMLPDINSAINGLTTTGGSTSVDGGGIANEIGSNLTILDCVIAGNTANNGGGIFVGQFGSVVVERTILRDNTATQQGGGASVATTSPSSKV